MTTQENIHSDENESFDGIRENRGNKPPAYFNLLFYGLILWGVIFMSYYLLSGWSSDAEFQEKMSTHREQVSKGLQSGK